jgi:hypothetical protein
LLDAEPLRVTHFQRPEVREDVLLLDALGHDADAQRLGDALEPSVLAAAKRTTG